MSSRQNIRKALLATSLLTLPWHAATAQEDSGDDTRVEETIVVTATHGEQQLIDVPASIAVQDTEELLRNGFTYGTNEFLGVTGVFFRRGEGDGDEFPFVSFRGSTGTEGSLSLVDGILIIGLYEETQTNLIPYEAIDKIEIFKGPVCALCRLPLRSLSSDPSNKQRPACKEKAARQCPSGAFTSGNDSHKVQQET